MRSLLVRKDATFALRKVPLQYKACVEPVVFVALVHRCASGELNLDRRDTVQDEFGVNVCYLTDMVDRTNCDDQVATTRHLQPDGSVSLSVPIATRTAPSCEIQCRSTLTESEHSAALHPVSAVRQKAAGSPRQATAEREPRG